MTPAELFENVSCLYFVSVVDSAVGKSVYPCLAPAAKWVNLRVNLKVVCMINEVDDQML